MRLKDRTAVIKKPAVGICPLVRRKSMGQYANSDGSVDCHANACAWWIEDIEEENGGCCAIKSIALTLNGMFAHTLDTE